MDGGECGKPGREGQDVMEQGQNACGYGNNEEGT